jgi:hypothetical protein
MDPAGPDRIWSEALVLEPENQDFLDGFGIAAPEFFAAIELRTHATDTGQLAQARVEIVDEGGEPVSGVAVYGLFTAGVHIRVQAYTDAQGAADFESSFADGARPGFQLELVTYELAGELAYMRPQSREPGELGTLDDHTIYFTDGMGTSTGSTENEVVEAPATESGSATGSSSRTAGETSTTSTDDGMGTSTGVTSEDEPVDNGMGTSTGVTSEDGPVDDGMGTSTGVASEDGPVDDGMGTSTGIASEDEPVDDGMGTSTGIASEDEPTDDGMGTSTGEQAPN